MYNNDLDIDLAKSVREYFRLDTMAMNKIQEEAATAVTQWEQLAKEIGISRS